jgi:uroporphyrin-III C-methyltransferase/precorrin-2 dehydrogenase/sirohydrochlorin ferrochelatase
MDYLPLFTRMHAQPCLVVGGGEVALRKSKMLLRAHAHVSVLAPELHPEIMELAAAGSIQIQQTEFSAALVEKKPVKQAAEQIDQQVWRLVIAATDNPTINSEVAAACKRSGIFCNVVDDRNLSTAIMPAIIDRSPLIIAVSSGGESPVLATRIRQQLERLFPPAIADLTRFAGEWRESVKQRFTNITQRRHFWQEVLDGTIGHRVLAGETEQAHKEMTAALATGEHKSGFAWIVGAGPGDPELLTLKAARILATADTILHDRLVAPAVLDMARKDATFISVGKQANQPSISQTKISALLVERVKAGERVCRLKGGDPFIFGRGREEIEALEAAELPWMVIPGISAANGCAAAAGIPLTYRNIARSVCFVTATTADTTEPDWSRIGGADQTVVVYMAVNKLKQICSRLIIGGNNPEQPALIIENGTTDRQRMIRGTLASIPAKAINAEIGSPAILITGSVAGISSAIPEHGQLAASSGDWAPAARLQG